MQNLNITILKRNISELLRNKNMSQEQLAQILEMSQSNVSKALNPSDKKCFTLAQVYLLSQHFGISIDRLIGSEVKETANMSRREIIANIVKLICDYTLKTSEISINEVVYTPYYSDENGYECSRKKKTVRYNAFYFPDYLEINDYACTDDERLELDDEFRQIGNDSKGKAINEILNALLPIVELYKNKTIPADAFQMILKGYLDKVKN